MKRIVNKNYIKDFVLEQKCIPWPLYYKYCKIRNSIFNKNTQKYWDGIWSKEKIDFKENRIHPALSSKVISLIPYKSKVIDIGCGLGILLERIKKEKGCEILGLDISKEAINTINQKNIPGIVAKVPPVPLPDDSFDVAISTELLEHTNNPKALLKEIVRITKPLGLLIIAVPLDTLHPHSQREHTRAFSEQNLRDIVIKFKNIRNIATFKIKEEEEEFYRLILKAEKC